MHQGESVLWLGHTPCYCLTHSCAAGSLRCSAELEAGAEGRATDPVPTWITLGMPVIIVSIVTSFSERFLRRLDWSVYKEAMLGGQDKPYTPYSSLGQGGRPVLFVVLHRLFHRGFLSPAWELQICSVPQRPARDLRFAVDLRALHERSQTGSVGLRAPHRSFQICMCTSGPRMSKMSLVPQMDPLADGPITLLV